METKEIIALAVLGISFAPLFYTMRELLERTTTRKAGDIWLRWADLIPICGSGSILSLTIVPAARDSSETPLGRAMVIGGLLFAGVCYSGYVFWVLSSNLLPVSFQKWSHPADSRRQERLEWTVLISVLLLALVVAVVAGAVSWRTA